MLQTQDQVIWVDRTVLTEWTSSKILRRTRISSFWRGGMPLATTCVMQSQACWRSWASDKHSKKNGINFSFTINDKSIHAAKGDAVRWFRRQVGKKVLYWCKVVLLPSTLVREVCNWIGSWPVAYTRFQQEHWCNRPACDLSGITNQDQDKAKLVKLATYDGCSMSLFLCRARYLTADDLFVNCFKNSKEQINDFSPLYTNYCW